MATRIADRTPVPANLAGGSAPSGASNRQLSYIRDLAAQRDITPTGRDELLARVTIQEAANAASGDRSHNPQGITGKRASEFIERLLARPKLRQEERPGQGGEEEWHVVDANTWAQMGQPSKPGEELWVMRMNDDTTDDTDKVVPRGSYALANTRGADNDVAFYSVWINKRGDRWSVKRYSSDELVGLPRVQQYGILERIAMDPAGAAERYGLLIGKCGICHRKLTNEESRKRGIGPICAARHGW